MPSDVVSLLRLRTEELRRRVESTPPEVKAWDERTRNIIDMNLHYSQMQAIAVLVSAFHDQQVALLAAMNPAIPGAAFEDACHEVVRAIVAGQRAWNFFRSKLDLRLLPQFAAVLKTADVVAYDCYTPVMDRAKADGIVSAAEVREPPLTYLSTEFSPLTWVRGKRPNDGRDYHLGAATLPIPVIELPMDHLTNSWELLSLHHEVGHDLEADLKLRPALTASLAKALEAAETPAARRTYWTKWLGEIVADLVALQLAGPAYADMLLNFLIMPAPQVTTLSTSDPHPTHYIRVRLLAAFIRTMMAEAAAGMAQELDAHATAVDEAWVALYGEPADLLPFRVDFPVVIRAVMDTPFPELAGKTLRAIIPYTVGDHASIKGGVDYLLTGQNRPAKISPRHVISAARIAVADEGSSAAQLELIDQRTNELVAFRAPKSLLGGVYPKARADAVRRYVAAFDVDKTLVPDLPDE